MKRGDDDEVTSAGEPVRERPSAATGDSRRPPVDAHAATALLSAVRLALEHGGAAAALAEAGIDLSGVDGVAGLPEDLASVLGDPATDGTSREVLALGFLAGRAAQPQRPKRLREPTSFLMDENLVVEAADGQSVLRLPWFDDELFVGRQLPDISEMPTPVRRLCVEHYSAALAGEPREFIFTSYGHTYSVEAVPVRSANSDSPAVLAVARPGRSWATASTAYERAAVRFHRSARVAEERAAMCRRAGSERAEVAERRRSQSAREAAQRAASHARYLRSGDADPVPAAAPALTSREAEVLTLASHGLTSNEIAGELGVSVATVRTHLENIYARLGVSNKTAAVAMALRHGLVE